MAATVVLLCYTFSCGKNDAIISYLAYMYGSSFDFVPADGYAGSIWREFSVCEIYEQCHRLHYLSAHFGDCVLYGCKFISSLTDT